MKIKTFTIADFVNQHSIESIERTINEKWEGGTNLKNPTARMLKNAYNAILYGCNVTNYKKKDLELMHTILVLLQMHIIPNESKKIVVWEK